MKENMCKIVEEGYEIGDFASYFRDDDELESLQKSFLDYLIKLLPKRSHVLDFGCGIGIPFDRYLIENGCKVTGIDISQKHIIKAKNNVPDGNFIKGDFSKISFEKRFNAIISFYSNFHLPREEHYDLFLKMYNILKENGYILITLGTSEGFLEKQDWCGAKMVWDNYDPNKYKELLKNSGFKLIKTEFEGEPDDEYHFWVLAQKE